MGMMGMFIRKTVNITFVFPPAPLPLGTQTVAFTAPDAQMRCIGSSLSLSHLRIHVVTC